MGRVSVSVVPRRAPAEVATAPRDLPAVARRDVHRGGLSDVSGGGLTLAAHLRPISGAACGPCAVPIPANIHEPSRIPPSPLPAFSRFFASVRGNSRTCGISGRTVREPINTGDFGSLRSHLRSPYRAHTRHRALGDPVYAIPHTRMLPRGIRAIGAALHVHRGSKAR
jgi:hypothetical protein